MTFFRRTAEFRGFFLSLPNMTVCSYHITYGFQGESALYNSFLETGAIFEV